MDIARPDISRKKRLRQNLYAVSATIAVALVTVGVSRLQPAAPVVAISYELWQRRYGANPSVLGRVLTIRGQAATIVG